MVLLSKRVIMSIVFILFLFNFLVCDLHGMNDDLVDSKRLLAATQIPVKKLRIDASVGRIKREQNTQELNHPKKIRVDKEADIWKCDLLAQIFSLRVEQDNWNKWKEDSELVEDTIALCDAPSRTDQAKKNILQKVFSSDIYNCLVHVLIKKKIVSQDHWLFKLDTFLKFYSLPRRAYLNVETLLSAGANPHVALQKYPNSSNKTFIHAPAALALRADIKGFKLLQKHGVSLDNSEHCNNPLVTTMYNCVSTPREVLNALLYHGADPLLELHCHWVDTYPALTPLKVSERLSKSYPELKYMEDLCKFGHVRRVYRLVLYLKRCVEGQGIDMPLELYASIVQKCYGPLSSEDWKIANQLSVFDYLKPSPIRDRLEAELQVKTQFDD